MPRLSNQQRNAIRDRTQSVLSTLLRFHVSFAALKYIHDDATKNWRELEAELHNGYPIKGAGIRATRANLRVIDESDGGFLYAEEDLFPGEVPRELDSFPYPAAAAAYVFTLLEGYGDDLVAVVNPGYLQARQAWHHAVHGDADLKDPNQLAKFKKGFTKPFNALPSSIPRYAVQRLVDVKAIRNEFMHEGSTDVSFGDFFSKVLGTIASIYFMLLGQEKALVAFPYYDYNARWSDV